MDKIVLSIILILLCLPGVWLMTLYSGRALIAKTSSHPVKSPAVYIIVFAQTLVLIAGSSVAGAYLGPKVGLRDRVLEGFIHGQFEMGNLTDQLIAGGLGGTICAIVWLISYYGFIRPRLDEQTVRVSENIRSRIGLWTRVTSGGIVEEVIFRWGLLSLAMWAASFAIHSDTVVFWVCLTVTGVLFGISHIPGYIAEGCKRSVLFTATSVVGNFWVALFCGYLLWHYGIIAAFIVHILFHLIWYPWEIKVARQAMRNKVRAGGEIR